MNSMRYMLLVIVLGCVAAAGCSQVNRPEQAQAGEKAASEVFLHEHLQQQAMVTTAEAYRAMIMLAEGEDRFQSFAAREEYLLANKFVQPEWKLQRDAAIDRGSIAYMVLRIVGLPGGVNYNILGRLGVGDRRYAMRELAYRDLMADGPPYRFISGAELVDVLGKADAYMAREGRYAEQPTSVVEPLGSRPAG